MEEQQEGGKHSSAGGGSAPGPPGRRAGHAGWGRRGAAPSPSPPCPQGAWGLDPSAVFLLLASISWARRVPSAPLFWGSAGHPKPSPCPGRPTIAPSPASSSPEVPAMLRCPVARAARGHRGTPAPPAHRGGELGKPPLAGSSIFTGTQEFAWRDNQLRPQDLAHYNNIKIKWDIETAVLKLLKGSEQM